MPPVYDLERDFTSVCFQGGAQCSTYLLTHKINKNTKLIVKVGYNIDEITKEYDIYKAFINKMDKKCASLFPKFYDIQYYNNQRVLVLEYIEGLTLNKFLEKKPEPTLSQISNIFKKIQKGIICFWKKGIIHGDLHLENIIITKKGNPKIIDFGLSHFVTKYNNKKHEIDVWFDKGYKKYLKFYRPGNPETVYFDLYKPMYAKSHKKIIKNTFQNIIVARNNNISLQKPITNKLEMTKIAKTLKIPKYYKMTKSELQNKIYKLDRNELKNKLKELGYRNTYNNTKSTLIKKLHNHV